VRRLLADDETEVACDDAEMRAQLVACVMEQLQQLG
jgi:hypothetical protein